LKTPVPLDLGLLGPRDEMLQKLREVRERALRLIEETKGRDLSAYRWPHPFLGMLNTYGWFELLASHQIRHEKQMREIAVCLRKPVADSQK